MSCTSPPPRGARATRPMPLPCATPSSPAPAPPTSLPSTTSAPGTTGSARISSTPRGDAVSASPDPRTHEPFRRTSGRCVLRGEEVAVGIPAHGPHPDVLPVSELVLLEHPNQPLDLDAGSPHLVVLSVHAQDEPGLTSEVSQLTRDVTMDLMDPVGRAGDDRAR